MAEMKEEQLAEIEARWAKATPGEWGWIIRGNSVQSHAVVCIDNAKSFVPQNICSGISPKTENAIAIANAPTDIQVLLAEVRRLQRAEEKALNYLEHNCCDAPQSFDCEETNRNCRDCWKEYLESEVGNNG